MVNYYPGMNNEEALKKVSLGYRMPRPSGCSIELHEIMLDCWKDKPEMRPSFEKLQKQLEVASSSVESNNYIMFVMVIRALYQTVES